MSIRIHRKRKQFTGDPARVIAKIFRVGGDKRAKEMIDRILAQPETEIEDHLENLLIEFSDRHHNFESILLGNFEKIKSLYSNAQGLSQAKKLLIGSYFTQEYSVESAALFNPSIINHPDQTNLAPGSVRFITSLRATGEGHLSSIVFRSGVLDAHHKLMLDSVSPYIETPKFELNPKYDKRSFLSKLHELHRNGKYSPLIFDSLDNSFSYKSLESRIKKIRSEHPNSGKLTETIDTIKWIAQSNYEIRFRDETLLSERVIFPIIANESKGIEDARFVQFQDSGNKACYYATYTAYNGHSILPMLMHTNDFKRFKMHTLHGDIAHDKGMALFPRKINGNYAMVSRHDGENLFVSFSKNIHIWDVADPIQFSRSSWEFVQTGNCGSPIETEKGGYLLPMVSDRCAGIV